MGPFLLIQTQMNAFLYRFRFVFAFGWLAIVSVLFFLPGSDLPVDNWMTRIPLFDKWIHVGIFAGLYITWSFALGIRRGSPVLRLFGVLVLFGLLVEVVQELWVIHRSFDWWDLLADFGGCLLGFGWRTYIMRTYIKK